jgi:hypothetical protein
MLITTSGRKNFEAQVLFGFGAGQCGLAKIYVTLGNGYTDANASCIDHPMWSQYWYLQGKFRLSPLARHYE